MLAVLVCGGAAAAQTVLFDSFEGDGGLTTTRDLDPNVDLAVAEDAGLAGGRALRLESRIAGTGVTTSDHLSGFFTPLTGVFTVQAWVRLTSTSGAWGPFAVQLHGQNNPNGTNAELLLRGTGALFAGVGTGGRRNFVQCADGVPVPDEGWHLHELVVRDDGVDGGSVTGYVDGVEGCTVANDWSGFPGNELLVGAGAYLREWTGVMWVDHVRVTQGVAVDRLVGAADGGVVGTCVPLQLDVAGVLPGAMVDREVRVRWRGDGGVVPSTERCLDVIPQGAAVPLRIPSLRLVTPGVQAVVLESDGLMPVTVVVNVEAVDAGEVDAGVEAVDAGADDAGRPSPRVAQVGCACGNAEGVAAVLWVVTLARRRRTT